MTRDNVRAFMQIHDDLEALFRAEREGWRELADVGRRA